MFLLAGLVRFVTALFAMVLVAHVVFVVSGANPANWLVVPITEWAGGLTLGLAGLFAPADPRLGLVVDHGLAALGWLVIGGVLGRLLYRLARTQPRRRAPVA